MQDRTRPHDDAEPAAAADARALAAAAHDLSGPVATIRANLEWLQEALQDGRLRPSDPEASGVVEDARAAAEALVRALARLRRASDRVSRRP